MGFTSDPHLLTLQSSLSIYRTAGQMLRLVELKIKSLPEPSVYPFNTLDYTVIVWTIVAAAHCGVSSNITSIRSETLVAHGFPPFAELAKPYWCLLKTF